MENYLEFIKKPQEGRTFRAALFDFDGTLSLIREGWQEVMVPYFVEVLSAAPGAAGETEAELTAIVREFVDRLTGKQTIFQCMALDDAVAERGGSRCDPMIYKDEYLRRLYLRINDRLEGLRSGKIAPTELLVRGTEEFLQKLCDMGIALYLASGTDQPAVREEAKLLGVDRFFGEHIYGALDEHATACTKELVIRRILSETGLTGEELLSFGDGYVEIELVAGLGGYAVAVATDEKTRAGVDPWKRERLIAAGASAVVPDFAEPDTLADLIRNRED
ncbi:MAG: HAD family hydrolase [Clostridia bacterium]|nr:HAD family hydrolase [Clostridia bacterium]